MSYKKCSTSRVQIVIYFFAALFMALHFSSCELFEDDEHCDYTRDIVKNWYEGYAFYPFEYQVDLDDYFYPSHRIENLHLGAKGILIEVDDLCNSKPAIVSAEINTKQYFDDLDFKPYVTILNKYENISAGRRFIRMTPTTVDATKYIIEPIEIPVWPDFGSEDFSSSSIVVTISILKLGMYCDEDKINSVCENYLNQVVKDAKITLSYTQY